MIEKGEIVVEPRIDENIRQDVHRDDLTLGRQRPGVGQGARGALRSDVKSFCCAVSGRQGAALAV